LTDGGDGLRCIRRLIEVVPVLLRREGPLVMEVGHDQAEEVKRLCREAGAVRTESQHDLQRIERVVAAWFEPRKGDR
jgi:release factor glutamine methyltransferase